MTSGLTATPSSDESSPRSGLRESHDIMVSDHVDVVVCGGGPAGLMAATAAARMGAKTLLVERHGFLGGMATAAMVGPMSKFNLGGKRIVGGLPEEFLQNLHALGGAIIDLPSGNIPYDPELYKLAAQRLALAAGVDVLLHAYVAGAQWEENRPGRLSHVLLETKSGRQAVAARMIIDATGTGDLISRTRLPCEMRNQRSGGELQPMTLYFRLGGVDTSGLTLLMAQDGTKYASPELRAVLNEEVAAGRLRNFGGPWAVHGSTLRAGEVSINATRFSGNAADARDITRAELTLREEVHVIVEAFRRAAPAFRNCYLIDTAPQVGIRETRSIRGLYTMTLDDVLTPRSFPDTVAKGGHPVDIHRASDSRQHAQFITEPYDIPYRTLVPEGSENVLVAGGLVSATREAFGSIRVQAQCMALGQAAGTAAALCLEQGRNVGELDGAELRQRLAAAGAIV
jgi:Dehydrogenases (flavoproteins)